MEIKKKHPLKNKNFIYSLIALNVLQEIYLMVTDEEHEWGWASAPSSTKDGATASQKALAKSG